jgi:hypothetical protein
MYMTCFKLLMGDLVLIICVVIFCLTAEHMMSSHINLISSTVHLTLTIPAVVSHLPVQMPLKYGCQCCGSREFKFPVLILIVDNTKGN